MAGEALVLLGERLFILYFSGLSVMGQSKCKDKKKERENGSAIFRVNCSDDDRGESFSTSTLAFYSSLY